MLFKSPTCVAPTCTHLPAGLSECCTSGTAARHSSESAPRLYSLVRFCKSEELSKFQRDSHWNLWPRSYSETVVQQDSGPHEASWDSLEKRSSIAAHWQRYIKVQEAGLVQHHHRDIHHRTVRWCCFTQSLAVHAWKGSFAGTRENLSTRKKHTHTTGAYISKISNVRNDTPLESNISKKTIRIYYRL